MKIILQQKARKLRESGCSLSEIHRELGVSKSSVSLWVKNVKLTPYARQKIFEKFTRGQVRSQEVLKKKHEEKVKKLEAEVFTVFSKFRDSHVNQMLICSLLYWCEGNKQVREGISFTNSDPNLIQTFVTLLRATFPLREEKFRVCVHLHSYHNEMKQKQFWSKITSIPLSQFTKSYLKKEGKKYKKEGYQGCIRVRYHDNVLARKLFIISSLFMKQTCQGIFR